MYKIWKISTLYFDICTFEPVLAANFEQLPFFAFFQKESRFYIRFPVGDWL